MKTKHLLGWAAALALLTGVSGPAWAQSEPVNQSSTWQFRDANARAVQVQGLQTVQALRSHTLGQGSGSTNLGAGGLLGLGSSATNNYTLNQTVTTNNCSASAAGAELACGGGYIQATTTQTTTSSSNSANAAATGNTLNNQPSNSNNISGK